MVRLPCLSFSAPKFSELSIPLSPVMSRARVMSRGHLKPMLDISGFLSKWKPVTFEESLNFVRKVKARDYYLYLSLFDILSRKENIPPEVYQELVLLFHNHNDLLEDLTRFRPHALGRRINDYSFVAAMLLFLFPLFCCSFFLIFEKPLRHLVEQTLGY